MTDSPPVLAACPFCESVFFRSSFQDMSPAVIAGANGAYVYCPMCKAHGPWIAPGAGGGPEAARRWNLWTRRV